MDKLRIGDRLVAARVISDAQLQEALQKQKEMRENGEPNEKTMVGMILVELGYIDPETMVKYLVDDGVKVDVDEAMEYSAG